MTATVLLADDDDALRSVLSLALTNAGYEVQATANISVLWQWIQAGHGDIVLTDVVMPDGDGIDFISNIHRRRPHLPVVVMSARSSLETAIRANQAGAYEYLPKPFDLNKLSEIIDKLSRELSSQNTGNDYQACMGDSDRNIIIGRSAAMQNVYRMIARMAGTKLSIMVTGETGTGKELVARSIHHFSSRNKEAFVAVNVASIPKDLVESELFGHEKGAFTGAINSRRGRFAQAEKGTLFLDEIGDMSADAQARLLRVLQEGEYNPVGSNRTISSDVRIIAATHRNILKEISLGNFREDLFYRLNVIPIRVPALRERKDDISDLCKHFLKKSMEKGLPEKRFSVRALQRLEQHHWPGNIRELENLVYRVSALYSEELITEKQIGNLFSTDQDKSQIQTGYGYSSESILQLSEGKIAKLLIKKIFESDRKDGPDLYNHALEIFEKPLLHELLLRNNGNQNKISEILGINRNTLRKKIRQYHIPIVKNGLHHE